MSLSSQVSTVANCGWQFFGLDNVRRSIVRQTALALIVGIDGIRIFWSNAKRNSERKKQTLINKTEYGGLQVGIGTLIRDRLHVIGV
jgi:hypothetical protein